jgi:hypothetical protein
MDASKKIEYQKLLVSLVPENGENIGNVSLREQLKETIEGQGDQLSDEDYWLLRDSLIDSGILEQGRGRGGSVHRIITAVTGVPVSGTPVTTAPDSRTAIGTTPTTETPTITVPETPEVIEAITEASLYEPFHNAIKDGYTKDNRLKRFISEITAHQGRRATGGRWTRPDVTVVAART